MSIDVLPGNAADEEQSVGDIGRKGMDGNDEKRKRGKEEKRKERNGVCPYDVFGVDRRRKS